MASFRIVPGPTNLDLRVATVRPAQLLQPAQKRGDAGSPFWIVRGRGHQHADPPHSLRLLRPRRKRPCRRCTAEQRDELAPPHVEPPPPESVHRILSLP